MEICWHFMWVHVQKDFSMVYGIFPIFYYIISCQSSLYFLPLYCILPALKPKTGLVAKFVSRDHTVLATPTLRVSCVMKIIIFENCGQLVFVKH